MPRALSRRLLVEFAYIRAAKQARVATDTRSPSPSSSPSPHTEHASYSWLLMCGGGRRLECILLHQSPMFAENVLGCWGRLRDAEVTNNPPDRPGVRANCAYSDILISFKWCALSSEAFLSHSGKYPVIYSSVCAVLKPEECKMCGFRHVWINSGLLLGWEHLH